jgi:hypothetical protein
MPCSNSLKSILGLDTHYIFEAAALTVRINLVSEDPGPPKTWTVLVGRSLPLDRFRPNGGPP